MESIFIDLAFPLTGQSIPADHGFALYGAISRVLPAVHNVNGIAIHPIRGQVLGNERKTQLTETSRLVFRTPSERIGDFLSLTGQRISVAGHEIRIGVPQVFALTPSTAVRSRLVVIKVSSDQPAAPDAETFKAALLRKLAAFALSPDCQVTLGKRRTVRVHDKEVVGYEVVIEQLSATESIALQTNSPSDPAQRFSRNHMGCGVFTALRPRSEGR